MNAANRPRDPEVKAHRTQTDCGSVILDGSQLQVPDLVAVRCPHCQKLLARCAVRGVVEIRCPRCKALVHNAFA